VHVVITYALTASLIVGTLMTIGGDMISAFGDISDSWDAMVSRSQAETDTRISGPIGLSVSATSTVTMTLANEGDVTLGRFADWDAIMEIQTSPGLKISYLSYTENASPGADQWTVTGIYLDASTLKPEITGIGALDPGEEMIVVSNPSTAVVANTYNRATYVTSNGVTAKVIFKVVP
jgi:hypothetical protein